MLTRSCCCGRGGGGGGGDCTCLPGDYAPPNPSQPFSYTVDFPGYTGKVRINTAVTNVNVRLGGLPGVGNSGVPGVDFGGLFCINPALGSCFPTDVDCLGCGDFYTYCGNAIDPVSGEPALGGGNNLVIEEHAVELTDFPCGTELDEYSAVRVNFVLTPVPSTCDEHFSRLCVSGNCVPGGGCETGCQCTPTAWDVPEAECVTPTFWVKGNECNCWPWLINAVAVEPGLVVTDPNSTVATMTANWNGLLGSQFTFTTTNNAVRIEAYRHRVATYAGCTDEEVCTTRPLTSAARAYTECDTPTDCCCQSELTVRVRVEQTYTPLGLTSYSTVGAIAAAQQVQNILFADYRSCDDEKLYDNALLGRPTREFKLHKVRCSSLAFILPPFLYRPEWSILNGYVPAQACELTLLYPTLYGSTGQWKAATYENLDEVDCACWRSGAEFEVSAEIGRQFGFPPTLILNRVTP